MDPISATLAILKPPAKYSFLVLIVLAIGTTGVLHFSNLIPMLPTNSVSSLRLLEWFLWVGVVVFSIALLIVMGNERVANQKLAVTFPLPHTHLWHEAQQQDRSINTQITADVLVKNRTKKDLGLASVRLIEPAINAPLILGWALIKDRTSRYASTTMSTGTKIISNDSCQVSLQVIVGGSLGLTNLLEKNIQATLGLMDEDGYETKVTTTFNIQ